MACLRFLFQIQGTTVVWGFNFLRVGGLKPFKLLKCIFAGGKKGKLFCNFSPVGSFCVNCKCACLCAIACYKLRKPCFILSGGCCKCVKLSYNYNGVKNNFTNGNYNFTRGSCKLTNDSYNFTKGDSIKHHSDGCLGQVSVSLVCVLFFYKFPKNDSIFSFQFQKVHTIW